MTLPPPAAITFAVSAPNPRDPPMMSAVLPANSVGATSFDMSLNEACTTGGHRRKACTEPLTPAPETIIRTIRNRQPVRRSLRSHRFTVAAHELQMPRSADRNELRDLNFQPCNPAFY